MPLHDHFRPPLANKRHWESFHAQWAVAIAKRLNQQLPPRFVAENQVHLGTRAEADVLEWDTDPTVPPAEWSPEADAGGGVAVAAPPDVSVAVDVRLMARYAVEIRDSERDNRLAGVIELTSPANKDRPESRRMFVGKMAGYLLSGVGLIVADVVTERLANLHHEFLVLFGIPDDGPATTAPTYAAAYAPVPADKKLRLDIWAKPLTVGQPLPTLPLQVLALGRVQVDLEATYREACEWSRIPD